jgi:tetratricopeptide (TPR) repeat protein
MTGRQLITGTSALVLLLAALVPRLLPAQVPRTRLLYEEGGVFGDAKTVTVRLTGPNGQVPPDTAATQTADQVHFLYRPEGDWTFADDAPETLRQIVLRQNGVQVAPATVALRGTGENATAARVAYPRSTVDWLRPVAFAHEVDTSATLSLPDAYAAEYPRLRRPYDRGRRLIDAGHPLRALDTLAVFYGEVTPTFDFVSAAKATLDTAAAAAVTREADAFQAVRKEVVSSPGAESLAGLDAFRARLDTVRSDLADYLEARPEAGTSVQRRLDDLDQSADALYDDAYETYRRQTVRVFFRKPYTRPKPALFIEALTRLLLDPQTALAASEIGVDSLHADVLMDPRYDDLRQTLRRERWWQPFQDVVTVVDDNLRRHDRVFDEKVFRSLKLQRTAATQPYYEILAALDAAAAGDQAAFRENWERALSTCTDRTLLNAMQHWRRARRAAPGPMPRAVPALMEDAERLRAERRPAEARQRLDRAVRQAPNYAPLRYERGRLAYEQGDTTVARTDFERARTIAPRYTAPRVATLRLLLDRGRYETALQRADSTLQTEPYWLVYFPKARALGGVGRPSEAVNVLRQRCEQLNDQSYALYVLLAQLYAQEKAWKGAAWAVQKAETLEPQRPAFVPRLQAVREKIRATDAVSLEDVGNDPAASGPSGQ